MNPRSGDEDRLAKIYRERFSADDLAFKRSAWKIICSRVLQRYVSSTDTVLDLGAGTCEFINAIRCGSKIAVDLNPEVARHAQDARVVVTSSNDLSAIESDTVNVVFTSNLLEHLPDKQAVLETLEECHRVLHSRGTLIIIMPNIRVMPGRYWDYFDHYTPLTHLAVAEAITLSGFRPTRVLARFLPYTVKHTRLPRNLFALNVYLRIPALWHVLGKQMLIVARRDP